MSRLGRAEFHPRGIIPALVTPMRDDESIDEDGLRALVEHVVSGGVHGVLVAGSQGEFYALTGAERRRLFQVVVETVAGRVPVYAGTGAPSTREAIELTAMAADVGASAATVITPYFIRPTQDELISHYTAIAGAVDIPLLLYSNPGFSTASLEPSTVGTLAQLSSIVGVKDSSGSLALTSEYIATTPATFSVIVGHDALIYATLLSGGHGAIAATANVVPKLAVAVYEGVRAGDLEGARTAQTRLARLRSTINLGTFPVVMKEAVAILGICGARARAPVTGLSTHARRELQDILDSLQDDVHG